MTDKSDEAHKKAEVIVGELFLCWQEVYPHTAPKVDMHWDKESQTITATIAPLHPAITPTTDTPTEVERLRVALETTSKGLENANTEWQKEIKLREHQGHEIGKLHSQLDRAKFLATDTRNDALREAAQYHKDSAKRLQEIIDKDDTIISSDRYGERLAGHTADADAILALIDEDKL